ncbi:nickel-responsive transcriptional regulator NikR [Myxococcota bacterium]|nr:nickel-responsive transcriptional regulator NikR [Myxococcota bacterium]MBU1432447.1 nickel-responsive transcriptional regulator NikR [Myxococcota bacterium]MBU1899982.1 nickel-responsive transcriptional regulator NikR [Myxococcota bacterium]
MPDLVRASLSIDQALMARFDDWITHSGHGNRSEAMRDLIRARLMEEDWDRGCHDAVATVTLLYDHTKRRLSLQIEDFGHLHHEAILASTHVHLTPEICLEITILRGAPDQLRHIAGHLIGLPGVLHGRVIYHGLEGEAIP